MYRYERFGFYTKSDIIDIVKQLSPEYEQNILKQFDNGAVIVSFNFVVKNQENKSTVAEISVEHNMKIFVLVEDGLYTDSKEFSHMVQANSQNISVKEYLDNILSQIDEEKEIFNKNDLGKIEEGRINE